MKIKPSKNLDLKAKMLKHYQGEDGGQFKNIDMDRVELESKIKHMPLSIERMTVQCKNDIAQCSNYQEFRSQLKKNYDRETTTMGPRVMSPMSDTTRARINVTSATTGRRSIKAESRCMSPPTDITNN